MSAEPNTATTNGDGVDTDAKVETPGAETTDEVVEVDTDGEAFKAAVSAEVEKVIGERIARDKKSAAAEKTRADTAEGKLSELEKTIETLTGEKANLETEKEAAERLALHLKLAVEENVSVSLIDALSGETEEQLRAAISGVREGLKSNGSDRIFSGKQTTEPKSDKDKMIQSVKDYLSF